MFRRTLTALISTLALAGSAALAQPQTLADVPAPPRLVPGNAPAASPVTASARESAKAATAAASAPVAARGPAAAASALPSNVRVIEDDEVRIEESRGQRGQLQRITVRNKNGGTRSYEIIVGPGGQDPSQPRGNTGQRAWSLFDF